LRRAFLVLDLFKRVERDALGFTSFNSITNNRVDNGESGIEFFPSTNAPLE
jgi:hypothetical protein